MGIFSKIKQITTSSHLSICQIDEKEIAIDLWDLNQTYVIDLENNKVYFDTIHSDDNVANLEMVEMFLDFLQKNKDIIV